MSSSKKDWELIKKQIKKTIDTNSSQKQSPTSQHTNWDDIEKHLRKKHHKTQKQPTTPQQKQPTIPQQKQTTTTPTDQTKPQDWGHIQKEIDTVFEQHPTRYQQPTSEKQQKKTLELIDTFFNPPPHKISQKPDTKPSTHIQASKKQSTTKEKEKKTEKKQKVKTDKQKPRTTPLLFKKKTTKAQQTQPPSYYKKRVTDKKAFHIPKRFTKTQKTKQKEFKQFFKQFRKNIPFSINTQVFRTLQPKKLLYENIVEIILFSLGLIFLFTLIPANMKIGLTLMLIASFLFFLMIDEKQSTQQSIPLSYLSKPAQTPRPSAYFHKKTTQKKHKQKTVHFQFSLQVLLQMPQTITRSFKQYTRQLSLTDRITIILISWTLLLFIITADIEIFFILIFIGILITKEMTDIYTSKGFKLRLNAYILLFLFVYVILISQKIITILQT